MNLENSENWRCTMRNINYGGARIQLAGALKLVPCPKITGTGRWQLLGVLLIVFSTSDLRAQVEPRQALEVRTLDSILVTVGDNNPMLQEMGRGKCRERMC